MVDRLIQYQLGLFGHPVKHSKSPQIHAGFAKQFGLNLNYALVDVTDDIFPLKFHDWMKTAHGCNITVPYKRTASLLVDQLTERAKTAAAVNTVYWRDGTMWGDNTDGDGLLLDLQHQKGINLKAKNILVIGSGGAVAGIIPALLSTNPAKLTLTNRSYEKAQQLAQSHAVDCVALQDLDQLPPQDLVIHGTSMGHQGLAPDLPASLFDANTTAYDLSYGAAAQPYLDSCKQLGCQQCHDGLGMLYGQAALAFEIWFGKRPEIKLP